MTSRTTKKPAAMRRTEIIHHARQLMGIDGAGALSLRAVAKRVGLQLASLQYHFPTHASLVDALVEDLLDRHRSRLRTIEEDTSLSSEKRLERALKWFAIESGKGELDAQIEIQFWALAQIDKSAKKALTEYHALYVDCLGRLIAAAKPKISTKQATIRAVSIACLIEGSILFVDLADPPDPGYGREKEIYRSACDIAMA